MYDLGLKTDHFHHTIISDTTLVPDVLLTIALLLDPSSALALLRVNREISRVLGGSMSFWRGIFKKLKFYTDEENPSIETIKQHIFEWENIIVATVKVSTTIASGEYRKLTQEESLILQTSTVPEEYDEGYWSFDDYNDNDLDLDIETIFNRCEEDIRTRANTPRTIYQLRETRDTSFINPASKMHYIYRCNSF